MHVCVYVHRKSLKHKTNVASCYLWMIELIFLCFSVNWGHFIEEVYYFCITECLWSWLIKYQSREIPRPTKKKKKNHGVNLFNNREIFRNMVLYVCQVFYFPSQMFSVWAHITDRILINVVIWICTLNRTVTFCFVSLLFIPSGYSISFISNSLLIYNLEFIET